MIKSDLWLYIELWTLNIVTAHFNALATTSQWTPSLVYWCENQCAFLCSFDHRPSYSGAELLFFKSVIIASTPNNDNLGKREYSAPVTGSSMDDHDNSHLLWCQDFSQELAKGWLNLLKFKKCSLAITDKTGYPHF